MPSTRNNEQRVVMIDPRELPMPLTKLPVTCSTYDEAWDLMERAVEATSRFPHLGTLGLPRMPEVLRRRRATRGGMTPQQLGYVVLGAMLELLRREFGADENFELRLGTHSGTFKNRFASSGIVYGTHRSVAEALVEMVWWEIRERAYRLQCEIETAQEEAARLTIDDASKAVQSAHGSPSIARGARQNSDGSGDGASETRL